MISPTNLWTVSFLILCGTSWSCVNGDAAGNVPALQETASSFAAARRFKLSLDDGEASVHPHLNREKRDPAEIHVSATGGEASDFDTHNSQFVEQITDFILNVIRSHIISQGNRQIELPDIHKSTCVGVSYLCVTIAFNATGGWFRDLSSVTRVGDVQVFREGEIITMDFGIGLKTMQLRYSKYKMKVGALEISGSVIGEIGATSIRVKFSMDVGRQSCSISLVDAKITFLGEPELQFTGMGKLNALYSKVMSWVANRARKNALPTAENILRDTIQDVFQRMRCEEEAEPANQ